MKQKASPTAAAYELWSRFLFKCARAMWIFHPKTIRRFGVEIGTSRSAINGLTFSALYNRRYEGPERRLIGRFLRPELPVVEVGASIGVVTCIVARTNPQRRYFAIEANPSLIPELNANLARNGVKNVDVQHVAIDYSGAATISLDVGVRGSLSALVDTTTNGTTADAALPPGHARVPATTLSAVVRRAGVDEFALICDIEGAELEVMDHEPPELIARCRQAFVEFHHVERAGGVRFTPAELAERMVRKWGMKILATEGDVWAFERQSTT